MHLTRISRVVENFLGLCLNGESGVESSPQEEGTACAKAQRKRDHVAGGTESSSVWLQLRVGCGDADIIGSH